MLIGPRGYDGKDEIFSGKGDDDIYADDGPGGDKVDCGRGFDEVLADPGDKVAGNCEVVI